jgi:hypothetical protein
MVTVIQVAEPTFQVISNLEAVVAVLVDADLILVYNLDLAELQ